MIREVELMSYLPPLIAGYQENRAALEAEDPEFRLLWEASDRVRKNAFIATADESGISRYEEMLGILPSKKESLEDRRARVLAKWMDHIPYRMPLLRKKMEALCRGQPFKVEVPDGDYEVRVSVDIEPGMEPILTDVQGMLEGFLPLNLYFDLSGAVRRTQKTGLYIGSTGAVSLKIKARPQKRDSYIRKKTGLLTGIGTMGHIRVSYRPGKE